MHALESISFFVHMHCRYILKADALFLNPATVQLPGLCVTSDLEKLAGPSQVLKVTAFSNY